MSTVAIRWGFYSGHAPPFDSGALSSALCFIQFLMDQSRPQTWAMGAVGLPWQVDGDGRVGR